MRAEKSLAGRSDERPESIDDVLTLAERRDIRLIDLKFVDLIGAWQHKTLSVSELSPEMFTGGVGFDGSSVRGFQTIDESDMLLVPDPRTAVIDPFFAQPTLSLICDISEPGMGPASGRGYAKDPRLTAARAESYLRSTGLADVSYWGPEPEFFLLDDIRYENGPNSASYSFDAEEAAWNTGNGNGQGKNLGSKVHAKGGYNRTPPHDHTCELRSEMVRQMEDLGLTIESHTHEVATAAQVEIDLRYDSLQATADKIMTFKYVVRNMAHRAGKTATFMPKPLFGDNGSGMHVHQSLWKDGRSTFADVKGYAGLSLTALYYIGGLLTHAPALLALTSPTTNSYKRLVPGYEAPVNIAFSKRNRSAAVRIPMYHESAGAKRVEFRPPDGLCNPYLSLAAMLMAGIDGIERKIDPVEAGFGPMDFNIYELPKEKKAQVKSVPGSLDEALDALEKDHDFLLQGNVFTPALLQAWIETKRAESEPIRVRPHPYEFHMYFDL
ncbi:MAG TPA: type I glutamate--ammonia ligase [Bacillota bacterium]|jgi:glutamine synthetase